MKTALLAAAVLVCCSLSATAGDMNLAGIGLSEMTPMSDVQGMDVRGKGFVWGESTATSAGGWVVVGAIPVGGGVVAGGAGSVGYATSTNGYTNFKQNNPTFGANFSIASGGGLAPTAWAGGFSVTN